MYLKQQIQKQKALFKNKITRRDSLFSLNKFRNHFHRP